MLIATKVGALSEAAVDLSPSFSCLQLKHCVFLELWLLWNTNKTPLLEIEPTT